MTIYIHRNCYFFDTDHGNRGRRSVSSNGTFVTDVANFTCDFGANDAQRVCQSYGMWSNMVPVCNRKCW